jgi:hypothetical protein
VTNSERIQANNEQLRESIELANSLPDIEGGEALKYIEEQHAQVNFTTATKLKPYAFYGDQVVVDVSIPNVVDIDLRAFNACKNLKTIYMPSVKSIANWVFDECASLVFPDGLPDTLEIISRQAFGRMTALERVTIPAKIWKIGEFAFYKCSNLKTVTFKSKPGHSLATNAFEGCDALTTINVPWAQGEVANAPWGATNATINYNHTGG